MSERMSLSPVEPSAAPAPLDAATALARRAAAGDLVATGQLLHEVAPRVSAVARAVLGPAHPDLDDAVQQSLIALLQALSAFRGECPPAAYAARIAVRVAVSVRKRARVTRLRVESLEHEPMRDSTAPSPSELSASERRKTLLRDLLADIPEEQAEALAMRAVLGWSLEEVATASGVPLNTVRSRVRLAKEALRRRIEADPRLAEELEVPS
jgi:RNA polymerase sigma-70 factor (ECF subfamily)